MKRCLQMPPVDLLMWRWGRRWRRLTERCLPGDLRRASERTGGIALHSGLETHANGELLRPFVLPNRQPVKDGGRAGWYRGYEQPSVCLSSAPASSCSLTRTESPSGPTWSGRTRRPAARPLPPCARRPPPPARFRPQGRTCAPAAARRSWTDICWRWEAVSSVLVRGSCVRPELNCWFNLRSFAQTKTQTKITEMMEEIKTPARLIKRGVERNSSLNKQTSANLDFLSFLSSLAALVFLCCDCHQTLFISPETCSRVFILRLHLKLVGNILNIDAAEGGFFYFLFLDFYYLKNRLFRFVCFTFLNVESPIHLIHLIKLR